MSHLKRSSTKSWKTTSTSLLSHCLLALKTQVISRVFVTKAFLIALFYLFASQLINEYAIYANIASQQFDLLLKLKIMILMFWKTLTMFGVTHVYLTLIIALLVGINVMMVSRKIASVRAQKNTQWTFGAGIVSLASTSCPGCGFSLLSITGLTTAIPGIPLQGENFSLVVLSILLFTAIYNLNSLGKLSCDYKSNQK